MRASCTPATSQPSCSTSRPRESSFSTGRTRSPPVPASRDQRRAHDTRQPRPRAHDPRARRLPRLRGHLEGAHDAAHAADVGDELHPRHRGRRRDSGPRRGRRRIHEGGRLHRDRPRVRERRRRLVRHRPDAGDVQAASRAEGGGRRGVISDRNVVNLLYLVSIVCFILALRFLSSPRHARKGNWLGGAGMVVAIVTTLLLEGIGNWALIVVGAAIGSAVGIVGARKVRMTAMPQMVALFNGVGGGAAALVALAEWHRTADPSGDERVSIVLSIMLSAIIGSISFAGSMIAFGKLQELIRGRPIVYPLQQPVNAALFAAVLAAGIAIASDAEQQWLIWALVGGATAFGVLFVLPIGGADMPVVISLLNAFTGLATAATGFELENNVLIVSGMLVGASGGR